jgi:phosphate uptake regulator
MEKDPHNIPQALDLIGITRSLERIADQFHQHRRGCAVSG